MLTFENGAIQETPVTTMTTGGTIDSLTGGALYQTTNCYQPWPTQTTYWLTYPVYVCSDRTKKAIDVLKALQADKVLECKSVPRFIALVEKIALLL